MITIAILISDDRGDQLRIEAVERSYPSVTRRETKAAAEIMDQLIDWQAKAQARDPDILETRISDQHFSGETPTKENSK